jgi:alkaline phosphatase D
MLVRAPGRSAGTEEGTVVGASAWRAVVDRRPRLRRRDFVLGAAATGLSTTADLRSWSASSASMASGSASAGSTSTGWNQETLLSAGGFVDVPPSHPFHAEITWVAERGIAVGYADGTYRPLAPVTRQAMAAFLHRLEGSPEGPFPDPGFHDLAPTHPFRQQVAWLVAEGIASGFSDRTFRPSAAISRQAMAAFLHRLNGEPAGPFPDPRLVDVGAAHAFRTAIHWMFRSDISRGFPDGSFRPLAPVSRQAMAAFLVRLVSVREDEARTFRHGVASGDPLHDGMVLWTRVTPVPGAGPGSGVGPATEVAWEVSTSSEMHPVVATGTVTTTAARDHTVKVDVGGLTAATTYWYRFTSGGERSPVGRTRTAPVGAADPEQVRFGVVSCSNLESGWFSAYRHLGERDDLDFVLHLGDYVYENGNRAHGAAIRRQHEPPHETVTLADYRQRHAQHKRDVDLQVLHARHPVVAVLDDHEVANDAWRDGAQNHTTPQEGSYGTRRSAAYQAYLEYLPIREAMPGSVERRLGFGRLADLHLLDLRRHRDQQVAATTDRAAIEDPARSITGAAQMTWLQEGLAAPESPQWRLIATSVVFTPVSSPRLVGHMATVLAHLAGSRPVVEGHPFNVDQWDGYAADRSRLLDHLVAEGIDDVVFLAGDLHCSWACDVPRDPVGYAEQRPGGESVATELVVPSVTSDNVDDLAGVAPRTGSVAVEAAFRAANPHVRLLEMDSHGYLLVDVTAQRLQAEWWFVSDRDDPTATQRRGPSWKVDAGSNRVSVAAESTS